MLKKDPLLALIQALTHSEKRYFKVFAIGRATKGAKHYLKLFELIDKFNSCDALILQKKGMSKELFHNFSFHKNYLYNHILRSLSSFNSKSDNYIRVQQLLIDIHILIEKKLIVQAKKRLNVAKKLTQKFQFDVVMIKLLFIERSIIRGYTEKKSFALLEGVHLETQKYLTHLVNRIKVTNLYDKTFLAARNKSIRKQFSKKVTKQINAEKEVLSNLDYSFEGKMIYHLLFATYYQMFEKEDDHSISHLKSLIEYYEANENIRNEYMLRYVNLLNNFLNFYYLKNDFTPFEAVIEKLKKLKPKTKSFELKIAQTIYHLDLVQHIRTQNYTKAVTLIPEIEQWLINHGEKIPKLNRLLLQQNIALAYFHTKNTTNALEWIRTILNEGRQDIRQDVNLFCKIMELLIHFDLKDFELVDHLSRGVIRQTNLAEPEEVAILFMNEVAKDIRKASKAPPHKIGKIFYSLNSRIKQNKAYINGKEDISFWLERYK